MTPKRTLLALALFCSLTSCASPSVYHPEKAGIGFTEERTGDLVYRISLHGNKNTPQSTVENLLLLRMAELTMDNDMDHFTVALDETICATKVQTSPTTTCTYERPVDATFPFMALADDFSDVGSVTREYEAKAMFIMGKGRVVSDTTNNYVAREVIDQYGHLKTGD